MNIVIGTDFSRRSLKAANVGVALAKSLHDVVTLVHAVPAALGTEREWSQRLAWRHNPAVRLSREATRLSRDDREVREALEAGPADMALVGWSRNADTRMLILSSRGRLGGSVTRSSVAERVALAAAAPTLILRNPGSLLSWLSGERALSVFAAFDSTPGPESILEWVRKLAELGKTEVTVGRAAAPLAESVPAGRARGGSSLTPRAFDRPESFQQSLKAAGLDSARTMNRFSWRAEEELILEMAAQVQCDLLICGAPRKSLLTGSWSPSLAERLTELAPMNALIVPPPRNPRWPFRSLRRSSGTIPTPTSLSLPSQPLPALP